MDLFFNGVHGKTGGYLRSPARLEDLARELAAKSRASPGPLRLWTADVEDPGDLSQTGWGVIFGPEVDDQIRRALHPLLEHRKAQATLKSRHYFRELESKPGETSASFLARHGRRFGPADPKWLPYYLLIVASPDEISYEFQYQLDVQYGVGRLWFETAEEFRQYAGSVIAAEEGAAQRSREMVFFAPHHPGDEMTRLSAEELTAPLASNLEETVTGWTVRSCLGDEATKQRLAGFLGEGRAPAVLFTAGHGIGLDSGDEGQEALQGALLCQGWTHGSSSAVRDCVFAAADVALNASLHGLVCFHFACYSAGTPQWDSFSHLETGKRVSAARRAFVARLPQRLLAHPEGGALAVIGHVDQAWPCSFLWEQTGAQLQTFRSMLLQLLRGYPVGAAMEYFGQRYAEIAAELSLRLEPVAGAEVDDGLNFVKLWLANNDARSYVVLGDPAVRLAGAAPSRSHLSSPAGTVWRGR